MTQLKEMEDVIVKLQESDCPEREEEGVSCTFCPLYFSGYCAEIEEMYKRLGYEVDTGEKVPPKDRDKEEPTVDEIFNLFDRLLRDEFGVKYVPHRYAPKTPFNEELREEIREVITVKWD